MGLYRVHGVVVKRDQIATCKRELKKSDCLLMPTATPDAAFQVTFDQVRLLHHDFANESNGKLV